MGIFKKRQYGVINVTQQEENDIPVVPDGTWIKCSNCGKILYKKSLEENLNVCTNCNYHFRLNSYERINQICDKDSFKEFNKYMKSKDQFDFPGYKEKLKKNEEESGTLEAVVTGECEIGCNKAIIAVMNSKFLMGSMGTVVGEKIAKTAELSLEHRIPLIIFTASGGARMQEGLFSLMQMAKTSAAVKKNESCWSSFHFCSC